MKVFGFAGWSGSGKTTLIEKLIPRFAGAGLRVSLIKHAPIPKLEVWRRVTGEPLLHPNDPHIVAIASDVPIETRLPLLDLDDDAAICSFILAHLRLQ